MSTRDCPDLNSFMMASLSFWGMSPCMDDTVKLASRIFSVNQSTLRLVLQKMTAYKNENNWDWFIVEFISNQLARILCTCVIVSVSYRSQRVSNFHSSLSTATKNCLMPSSVNSSRLTRIRIGSVMNLDVISRISCGRVAEMRTTYKKNDLTAVTFQLGEFYQVFLFLLSSRIFFLNSRIRQFHLLAMLKIR